MVSKDADENEFRQYWTDPLRSKEQTEKYVQYELDFQKNSNHYSINPITLEDLSFLRVDQRTNELYWAGKKVEVKKRLSLTKVEKIVAALVSIAIIVGGLYFPFKDIVTMLVFK